MPAQGVYAAFASLDGEIHKAVVNIGTKPTFHEEYPLSVEAHIIDFNKNIYGQTLRLYLVKNIRKERKFSGMMNPGEADCPGQGRSIPNFA